MPAGLGVAEAVFARVDPDLHWEPRAGDGGWREPGVLAEITGSGASILTAERVALNFLGRLSGVATLTARYVQAVEGTGVRILDTRKTTPGHARAREGGGARRRRREPPRRALRRRAREGEPRRARGRRGCRRRGLAMRNRPGGVPVEVECATLDEVRAALDAGVPRLLLDNMGPDELREAVGVVAGRAELEASGGITLDTIRAVAETGVDFISIGALTHSAPALDVSLLLDPL